MSNWPFSWSCQVLKIGAWFRAVSGLRFTKLEHQIDYWYKGVYCWNLQVRWISRNSWASWDASTNFSFTEPIPVIFGTANPKCKGNMRKKKLPPCETVAAPACHRIYPRDRCQDRPTTPRNSRGQRLTSLVAEMRRVFDSGHFVDVQRNVNSRIVVRWSGCMHQSFTAVLEVIALWIFMSIRLRSLEII